jgi:hypothetical protein
MNTGRTRTNPDKREKCPARCSGTAGRTRTGPVGTCRLSGPTCLSGRAEKVSRASDRRVGGMERRQPSERAWIALGGADRREGEQPVAQADLRRHQRPASLSSTRPGQSPRKGAPRPPRSATRVRRGRSSSSNVKLPRMRWLISVSRRPRSTASGRPSRPI